MTSALIRVASALVAAVLLVPGMVFALRKLAVQRPKATRTSLAVRKGAIRAQIVSVVIGFGLLVIAGGCGGSASSPTSPTRSAATPPASGVVAISAGTTEEPLNPVPIDYPDYTSGPTDVTFPPRNEPLLFRTALEAQYRDVLRRTAVPTSVDPEGTVVWTQEYLRYRVNLCPHAEAVFRVFRQIDGFGVLPTCGTTSTVVFPPRNEPFDFMLQLEAKYRDGLRRPSVLSFVDIEGNIVWTQEYLWYRVTGCNHADAQLRVFDQIAGRGVQPACGAVSGGAFSGTWRGTAQSTSCSTSDVSSSFCGTFPTLNQPLTLILTQNGSDVRGTIDVGDVIAPASGSATGNRLSISGRTTSNEVTISYENWDTSLSGSSMLGTFDIRLFGASGSVRYTMNLSGVSRSNSVSSTEFQTGNTRSAPLKAVSRSMRSASPREAATDPKQ